MREAPTGAEVSMQFFESVLEYWFLPWIIWGYARLFRTPIRRFVTNVEALCASGLIFAWNPRVFAILFAFFTAPILWVWFLVRDRREARKQKRRQQQEEYARQRKLEKKQAEARRKLFDEWRKAYRPTLYYNVANGITAVVQKDDYDQWVVRTARARLDGLWENERVLMLIPATSLFIHASAEERVPTTYRTGRLSNFADLQAIAEMVRKEELFVPLASEGILMFAAQKQMLQAAGHPRQDFWECPSEVVAEIRAKVEAIT